VGREVGRAVAEIADAEIGEEPPVVAPALVMTALLHLVLADGPALPLDRGIAVLDTGGEEKTHRPSLSLASIPI
jgi:hypothetical protein